MTETITDKTVCVVGLGYVGLPLAEAFAAHMRTIGFRRDQAKVDELNGTPGNRIEATTDPAAIREADFVIIAVPTPVTRSKDPDFEPVVSASETVGQHLKPGAIVVLESTVYPGASEEFMIPALEAGLGHGLRHGLLHRVLARADQPRRRGPRPAAHLQDRRGPGRGHHGRALRPLRPRHQRLPRPRHPDGRGREGH